MYFIMTLVPVRAPAREMDWDTLRAFADAEIIETLQSNPEFASATNQREQYYYAYLVLHVQHRPAVPLSMIGRLFNVSKATIRSQYKTYIAQAGKRPVNGRPPILTPEEQEDLVGSILDAYAGNRPWTMRDIVAHITERYAKTLDQNTIRHLLNRDMRVRPCRGVPIEDKRLQVTAADIRSYFDELTEAIESVPAHFIYNMDEMGHQEWADRQEQVCYVPVSHEDSQVYFPVPRTGKRITLVACIAADGSYLKPLIVIPRKTYDADLGLTGLTDEKVTVYSQAKGYTDRPIFHAWLTEIFLPEVARRRDALGYGGQAVLILDNCTAHTGPEIAEACASQGIIMCPLPPHSSNQIQPLDLSTFGVTKRHIARANRMEAVNLQSRHIAEVVSSFMAAAAPMNVVATFASAGITLFLSPDGKVLCRVCPERARCLICPIEATEEPMPTEDEVAEIERDIYVEHCAEHVTTDVPSGID